MPKAMILEPSDASLYSNLTFCGVLICSLFIGEYMISSAGAAFSSLQFSVARFSSVCSLHTYKK